MFLRFIAILCLAVPCAGCGSKGPELFTVQGIVTFSGAPQANGTICFEDATAGFASSSNITTEGKYTIDLPNGNYKIFLLPSTEEKKTAEGMMDSVAIDEMKFPRRYRSSETSGLSLNLTADATLDVSMSAKP